MKTTFKVIWSILVFLGKAGYAIGEAIAIIILVLIGPVGWFILFLCWMEDRSDRIKNLEKEVAILRMTSQTQKGQ